MAKINGINFSDKIPKEHTRAEFINKFGHINCGGCKDLGALYDKIVKASGVAPKAEKKPEAAEELPKEMRAKKGADKAAN